MPPQWGKRPSKVGGTDAGNEGIDSYEGVVDAGGNERRDGARGKDGFASL